MNTFAKDYIEVHERQIRYDEGASASCELPRRDQPLILESIDMTDLTYDVFTEVCASIPRVDTTRNAIRAAFRHRHLRVLRDFADKRSHEC